MDKIKKMWCNLSLRKSIILYISAFVILAILLSAGTATLCNNATKTIESKYPPTGEKYYLTNENGERLGDGNYIGVAPVAMSEKDQRLLSICEVAPIIATPIYSALCIITATLLFYRNKLKKPLTELKAASEMISNNNLNFSIKYDSKDELGELCSSFETMRFTLANNFSEMWRQMEERKQLNAAFAHDLRTPLTVLKGYNEILQSNHDPITKSTAVTMGKHIFRLERYVDSMSHLRRLEDAQPISDKSNISGYVTAIADSARILCEQSGKTLSIQNNISDIPIGIDYTFVSQVNNNLIVIFNLLIAVAIYGTEGLDCSILFAPIDFLEGYIPFNITCGTVLKYQILLAFMSAISVTGIVLILSAVCKSQMIAFVISAAIYVIPIMLPISETSALYRIIVLMPLFYSQYISIMSVEQMHNGMLYAVWSIPVAIALVVIGSIISHKAFSKHQVR